MKLLVSSFFFLLISFMQLSAQDKLPDREMFMVHEDVVYPYMQGKYETAAKDFVDMLKEANVEGSSRAFQTEYFTYSTLFPIKDYEGLASYIKMRSEMVDKIGDDKMSKVMSKFDGCYASHRNYLITLRNDLSYKPLYGLNPDEDLNFRHFDYINVIPGKENEMNEILKDYKTLYESKNIEEGYRVYYGGIGTDMPYIILVQPAKGRVDWATMSDRQDEELGEEGSNLLKRMMSITQKFEHKDGMMRPDLYYTQKK